MRRTLWDEIKWNAKSLLKPYEIDIDKYTNTLDVLYAPCMIIGQIGFWIYCTKNESLEGCSLAYKILYALLYSFGGGIGLCILVMVVLGITALILKKKPVGLICAILGVIGTALTLYFMG